MSRLHRLSFLDHGRRDADRQTASLAALAFALLLVVVGLFLVKALHEKSAIENCLMAGRSNCDALVTENYGHQR